MKKTLYSLMLNDEVVREVDMLAHRLGTNRSSLINQILAEYVDFVTPERRINDIFSAMEALLKPSRELVPVFVPNAPTMAMKSSLEYKYRPTVKYEVELFTSNSGELGELSVLLRTRSASLISALDEFFALWKNAERRCMGGLMPAPFIRYAEYDGKLVRGISKPEGEYTAGELADTITGYISFMDEMLKAFLAGRVDRRGFESAYTEFFMNQKLHI